MNSLAQSIGPSFDRCEFVCVSRECSDTNRLILRDPPIRLRSLHNHGGKDILIISQLLSGNYGSLECGYTKSLRELQDEEEIVKMIEESVLKNRDPVSQPLHILREKEFQTFYQNEATKISRYYKKFSVFEFFEEIKLLLIEFRDFTISSKDFSTKVTALINEVSVTETKVFHLPAQRLKKGVVAPSPTQAALKKNMNILQSIQSFSNSVIHQHLEAMERLTIGHAHHLETPAYITTYSFTYLQVIVRIFLKEKVRVEMTTILSREEKEKKSFLKQEESLFIQLMKFADILQSKRDVQNSLTAYALCLQLNSSKPEIYLALAKLFNYLDDKNKLRDVFIISLLVHPSRSVFLLGILQQYFPKSDQKIYGRLIREHQDCVTKVGEEIALTTFFNKNLKDSSAAEIVKRYFLSPNPELFLRSLREELFKEYKNRQTINIAPKEQEAHSEINKQQNIQESSDESKQKILSISSATACSPIQKATQKPFKTPQSSSVQSITTPASSPQNKQMMAVPHIYESYYSPPSNSSTQQVKVIQIVRDDKSTQQKGDLELIQPNECTFIIQRIQADLQMVFQQSRVLSTSNGKSVEIICLLSSDEENEETQQSCSTSIYQKVLKNLPTHVLTEVRNVYTWINNQKILDKQEVNSRLLMLLGALCLFFPPSFVTQESLEESERLSRLALEIKKENESSMNSNQQQAICLQLLVASNAVQKKYTEAVTLILSYFSKISSNFDIAPSTLLTMIGYLKSEKGGVDISIAEQVLSRVITEVKDTINSALPRLIYARILADKGTPEDLLKSIDMYEKGMHILQFDIQMRSQGIVTTDRQEMVVQSQLSFHSFFRLAIMLVHTQNVAKAQMIISFLQQNIDQMNESFKGSVYWFTLNVLLSRVSIQSGNYATAETALRDAMKVNNIELSRTVKREIAGKIAEINFAVTKESRVSAFWYEIALNECEDQSERRVLLGRMIIAKCTQKSDEMVRSESIITLAKHNLTGEEVFNVALTVFKELAERKKVGSVNIENVKSLVGLLKLSAEKGFKYVQAIHIIGRSYFYFLKDVEQAGKYWRLVLGIIPNHFQTQVAMIEMYLHENCQGDAQYWLIKILQLYPSIPYLHYLAARLSQANQNYSNSVIMYLSFLNNGVQFSKELQLIIRQDLEFCCSCIKAQGLPEATAITQSIYKS